MNCPQELPPAPPGKHYHLCADNCGNYHSCTRTDGCDNEHWICPKCEADRLDHYWTLEQQRIDAQRSA